MEIEIFVWEKLVFEHKMCLTENVCEISDSRRIYQKIFLKYLSKQYINTDSQITLVGWSQI